MDKNPIKITTRLNIEPLNRLMVNVLNMNSALRTIGILMKRSILDNFTQQGRPVKWQKLSAYTLAMRKQKQPKILMDTGRLRQSIDYQVESQSVKIGTNLDYARKLQEGGETTIPARIIYPKKASVLVFEIDGKTRFTKYAKQPERKANIPERPFVMIQEEDIPRIRKILIDKLETDIKVTPQ